MYSLRKERSCEFGSYKDGCSLRDMAMKIGISYGTLHDMERGFGKPTRMTRHKLEKHYNLETGTLDRFVEVGRKLEK